ncbi:ATP-binding protein [Desulfopila aestuarii]|uniref:histidine kinase n=1 Tax=Desulfopila aestuarii DSM 18488 TaxID=1121416 RepID=A0A1M7YJX5_9BACT|nr:ATP-binding protein [Desulfopila aestuarii]SHO52919.1 HAMP domain-containing protein [Desulfopila aestuarii DSM 18488]
MRLRDKVILTCLLTALLSVLAISALSLMISGDFVRKEGAADLTAVNSRRANQILQWTSNTSRQLEVLGQMPIIHEKLSFELEQAGSENRAVITELLETIVEKHLRPALILGTFSELFLLEVPSGKILASTDPKQIGKMQGSREYFIKGQLGTHIQNIFYSMSIRQPTMVVSLPIGGNNALPNAVLAGRLNLSALSDILREWRGLWQTEDSYLVNNQHIFITEPRYGKNFMLRKTVYTEGVNRALNRQNGISWYKDYRGKEVIGAYQYLDDRELALITEVDGDDYLAAINKLKHSLYLSAILIATLSLVIGWLVAKTIVTPLTSLAAAIDRISSSNLKLEFEPQGAGKELITIVNAFRKMIQGLQTTLVSRDQLQKEVEQRKIAESDLLVALDQVKRSNAELEQFAYVASHDLQEPLRMVASYNQLLAQRYGPQLDEKAQKYIHYAVDGANRMQTLIQDLLTFSRVSTKGAEFGPVDFQEVVSTAILNLEMLIEESGAQITVQNLPTVSGDGGQLTQLMQNLIANSIKFRSEAIPTVHIEAQRQQEEYIFSIRDNGIGIDKKYSDKIFVVFQRLHTREEYPGTGIGLAVCKRIVERHGGSIWFDSAPGQGTTFSFTLKRHAAA